MKKYVFEVPKDQRVRVIIDSDAACEGDDQYAIVHALLCSKLEVKGIIAEHYGIDRHADSMEQSYYEIKKILDLMGRSDIPVYRGARMPLESETDMLASEAHTDILGSEGADFIISECQSPDERPLFILNQGALTTLACALKKVPYIENKMVCISIGGTGDENGGFEFNYANDPKAAAFVMHSGMEIWQIPESVYGTMQVGFMELYDKIYPCGAIGKYLFEHLREVEAQMHNIVPVCGSPHEQAIGFPHEESWILGDSCAVGVLLFPHGGRYITQNITDQASTGGKRRIYQWIDTRAILEDFFARLKYHCQEIL